jgi:iron complex outermembrane receptor protein
MAWRAIIFVMAGQLFVAGLVPAADVPPTNAPVVLPPIKVIGHPQRDSLTSPTADKAAEQKKEIPGAFTVKSDDEMEKGRASNFQDLLQGTPGVVLQTENGSEVSKISIRGSGIDSEDEPLGVEFLQDGLTFNQGDGEVILEDLDVGTVQYAEVYRGADAFKYGALTLGGAINLVPYTGYTADPFRVALEAGSYGFFRGQASTAGVEGPFDYYASVMGRYRDGFRVHSRENTELFFTDVGYKFNNHVENRFYVTVDRTDRELPGGLTKPEMNQNPRQADPDAIAQNFNKDWSYYRLADKLSFKTEEEALDAGFFFWHRNLQENGFFSPDFREGVQTYHSDNIGLLLNSVTHSELFNKQNILTAGVIPDVEWEYDQNFENLAGHRGDTTAKDVELSINVPLYAENQHYLTDKLSLITGIQLIYARRHFSDLFLTSDQGDQSSTLDLYGWSPKIGLIYEIDTNSQAFLNFSKNWQPPSFDNMVGFESGTNGSLSFTALSPQRAWTLEIGTRGEQGRFDWDLALYRSWIRDELLDVNGTNDVDLGDINIGRSYHQGIEAGLDTKLLEGLFVQKKGSRAADVLTFNQTYTLNDFHFSGDPVNGDKRIAGIPIHQYEAELMYETPGGFYAGPNVQCNLTRYPVDQANTLFASAYQLLGFKIGLRQDKGFSIFFEAKNLLDERYAASVDPIADAKSTSDTIAVFHPGDGRSFYGGVSYAW